MANLDTFVTRREPLPESLFVSPEILDRDSRFVGYIFRASTPEQARTAHTHLKRVMHAKEPASHEIAAWRCMVLKPGKTGLGGEDDFVVVEGSEDDGESWAGGRVLKIMKAEAVMDAVVVVSRWYGGIMLGPIRFTHMEDCAREVCRSFRVKDELEDTLTTLLTLDDILADLRATLEKTKVSSNAANSQLSTTESKIPRRSVQDYSSIREKLDVAKAKRLVVARESAIKNVKVLISKAQGAAAQAPGK
ncbi:ribosomal protein S5 domain 2-like protein [Artomyces pyxidatus]|uniref:Ribosomal protein S5 domain 2-like protein n=1 Tax=Artomyces pyxidatus TaxID=48021 RepID=A0ACB8T0Y3_9AGAM|nr:ribosomal protein S5 domain 2-like protein [Artomyces pyxidatus]